ncbi:hypothetical protein L3Q82_004118 [Scortum barcoo]|uniref:Uncharacterized protein n=1 Tax=Scortum barcoo TaxID=214431 RepID=A0ACB8X6V6_9TELE|nr:hypothetical protein L3Q82_004118 [Scortum barcoo]
MVASDHEEEDSGSVRATEEASAEETVSSEPVDSGGNELPAVETTATAEDLDDQPQSHEGSVVFEINSSDEDGPPRLHLETPEREAGPMQEEEDGEAEEEEPAAPPADMLNINYEEYLQLQQQLCEERDEASHRSSQLQIKLADYLSKKGWEDSRPEREPPESEQLQEYEKCVKVLSDLKQQLATDSETAQQQAEELSSQAQERLDEVENEWQEFVALKQDVAVAALSRRLGKQAAQAKVEATLAAEQLLQDELIKLRLRHIKLRMQIQRLEAELREGDDHARDPLHLQFEQLQAERLEQKKQAEKQKEESLRVQKKISSSLELLSNIKEKLFWSQTEVQAKRRQLVKVEAAVARKRELLTRTKQAHNSLQRDNVKLKDRRGLLGNRVLLQDFEDTVDASSHLEERLENLKGRQAEIVFSCGR